MKCGIRLAESDKACGAPAVDTVLGIARCRRHMPPDVATGACSHSLSSRGRCSYCGARTEIDPSFHERVDRSAGPAACWPWIGAVGFNGYGDRGRGPTRRDGYARNAHRAAYEHAHGPVPDGKVVRHDCDFRLCCNPSHMRLGSLVDNALDQIQRGRVRRGSAHRSAKLNEQQAGEILRRRLAGEPEKDLAAEFGVAPTTVRNIVNGRAWQRALGLAPVNRGAALESRAAQTHLDLVS